MPPLTLTLLLLPHLALLNTFWHFSDLHLDLSYAVGSKASNLCHSPTQPDKEEDETGAGAAGAYGCDSPPLLALSSLEAMARLQPNVSLILWTGDSSPHWRASPPEQKYIANITNLVFSRLSQLFPGVPVVAAVGNHDISPPDQWPVGGPAYASLWDQGGFSSHIPSNQQDSFLRCGFYSTRAAGLDFLVLNTNFYLRDHEVEGDDPCGQLKWLEERLVEAEQRGGEGKVYIVGHVPPGGQSWGSPQATVKELHARFLRLLIRFSHLLAGQLYGHTHSDSFRLIRSETGKPVGLSLVQGSVSPITGCNPSVRLYSYTDQCGLEDFVQFFLDLHQVNVVQNISAVELGTRWKLLYRASESYGLKDLSPSSFDAFWTKLRSKENGSGLFDQYQLNSMAGKIGLDCDDDCWRKTVCTAGFTNATRLKSCLANLRIDSGRILESPSLALAAFLLLLLLLTSGFCWMRAHGHNPDDHDEQVLLQEQQVNLHQDLQFEPPTFVVTSYGSGDDAEIDFESRPPPLLAS